MNKELVNALFFIDMSILFYNALAGRETIAQYHYGLMLFSLYVISPLLTLGGEL